MKKKIYFLFLAFIITSYSCSRIPIDEGKLPAPNNVIFERLTTYKAHLTAPEILSQIKSPVKLVKEYTLKNISFEKFDRVQIQYHYHNGVRSNPSITFREGGIFIAKIVLEHIDYEDIIITSAEFEIKKLYTPKLTFDKLVTSSASVTSDVILEHVRGEKKGYTIKYIDFSYFFQNVLVSGRKPNFTIHFRNSGQFTAKIVLEHATYEEVTLQATFVYRDKYPAPALTISKVTATNDYITSKEILNKVQGRKDGYVVKSIMLPNNTLATVMGVKPNIYIKLEGANNFIATLVLEHNNYRDVILKASFERQRQIFIFDRSDKAITGIKSQYKNYVKTLNTITFPDEIEGVKVEKIKGDDRSSFFPLNVFGDSHNTHIQKIILPKYLKTIGGSAFYSCTSITTIVLPNTINYIDKKAFSFCTNLTAINFPLSIRYILEAFHKCNKLVVTLEQPQPNVINIFGNTFGDVKQIKVPKNSLWLYHFTHPWNTWRKKIVALN